MEPAPEAKSRRQMPGSLHTPVSAAVSYSPQCGTGLEKTGKEQGSMTYTVISEKAQPLGAVRSRPPGVMSVVDSRDEVERLALCRKPSSFI